MHASPLHALGNPITPQIGYSWVGCTSEERPFPAVWGRDYGEPTGPCAETAAGSGVFERKWTKATIRWDCNAGEGAIGPAE